MGHAGIKFRSLVHLGLELWDESGSDPTNNAIRLMPDNLTGQREVPTLNGLQVYVPQNTIVPQNTRGFLFLL